VQLISRFYKKISKKHASFGLYIILLIVIAGIFIALPKFRTIGNINNLLLRSIPLLAVSVGQTLVLISAGIDLSVGAILALATTVASVTMDINIIGGIFLVIGCGVMVGFINGICVTKLKINPFLVTLGTTIIISGIALFIRPYPGGVIPAEYVSFVMKRTNNIPIVPLIIFAMIIVTGIILLKKSLFGRHLYAVGGNAEAARLAGINTNGIIIGAYVLSGFFASIGGLYMTARIGCGDPAVGVPFQMESITAAVIGGTALTGGRGGITGTALGVILVVMLGNIFNLLDINFYWQQALRGSVLLLVVGFSQYSIMKREKLKQKMVKR